MEKKEKIIQQKIYIIWNNRTILIDKELHHGENENKFTLGDIKNDTVYFIHRLNTELERKEVNTINYIILLSSIIIVIIVIVVIIFVLLCYKKDIPYRQYENEYVAGEQHNQIKTIDDNGESCINKISFEENNPT